MPVDGRGAAPTPVGQRDQRAVICRAVDDDVGLGPGSAVRQVSHESPLTGGVPELDPLPRETLGRTATRVVRGTAPAGWPTPTSSNGISPSRNFCRRGNSSTVGTSHSTTVRSRPSPGPAGSSVTPTRPPAADAPETPDPSHSRRSACRGSSPPSRLPDWRRTPDPSRSPVLLPTLRAPRVPRVRQRQNPTAPTRRSDGPRSDKRPSVNWDLTPALGARSTAPESAPVSRARAVRCVKIGNLLSDSLFSCSGLPNPSVYRPIRR